MSHQSQIVFLVNLLQDVNIIRPLLYSVRGEFDAPVVLLVTDKFLERDKQKIWQAELTQLAGELDCQISIYDSPWTAFKELQSRAGVLIAASESNLSAHVHTHDVFRAAPPSYLKITLQHGYECVGFLQSKQHDAAHGRNIRFAADVICAWCDPSVLSATVASERSKVYVSGPSTLIETPQPAAFRRRRGGSFICENLHSVRLRMGNTQSSFLEIFSEYCAQMEKIGEPVILKPHPGGQYVVKNKVDLPGNVELETRPIYQIDLSAFDFGISPPSSIVIDMVLAGIPVAVWQDRSSLVDTGNFSGLTFVVETPDWLAFRRDALLRRPSLLERQQRFLAGIKMLVDPAEIRRRYMRLIGSGLAASQPAFLRRAALH